MGKGDKKSRRGKIHIGSHGTRRPRKKISYVPEIATPKVKEKSVKPTPEPAKKVAKAAPVIEPVAEIVEVPVVSEDAPAAIAAETEAEVKKAPRKTTKKAKEATE